MTDTRRSPQRSADNPSWETEEPPTGWVGMIAFGGTMLMLVGSFHVIQGLVALFKDEYYLVTASGLTVNVDYTQWGWTHLILGGLAIAAGLGLLVGQMWARVVAVLIAFVSAIVNVTFLAAYPVWSSIMIAIDVLVIWAVMLHGREMKPAER